nr:formylmethanofuran dehydrogenase subunit E family protein [uncultured Holophaga sp.]
MPHEPRASFLAAVPALAETCTGPWLSIRMALLGLRWLGRDPFPTAPRWDLLLVVESDRCASDALMALTGCRPGRRTMKVLDFGKLAVTFIDLETRKACRVSVRPQALEGPGDPERLGDEELFRLAEVEVALAPQDLPGPPLLSCPCAQCGEEVLDGRQAPMGDLLLCQACAEEEPYFTPLPAHRQHAAGFP